MIIRERVLIVDDESISLKFLSIHLKNRYDVLTAKSGAEGLAVLKAHDTVAVVISDLQMPEMTGVEFLSQVKELSPQSIRLLMTAGAEYKSLVQSINESEVYRFIPKPIHTEFLNLVMDKAINKFRFDSELQNNLSRTLAGAVKLLTEMQISFDKCNNYSSEKLVELCVSLGKQLDHPQPWEVSLAAKFLQLGRMTLPATLLVRLANGQELSS